MNRYRAYMNRIHAPSGLRHRVLEAAERIPYQLSDDVDFKKIYFGE